MRNLSIINNYDLEDPTDFIIPQPFKNYLRIRETDAIGRRRLDRIQQGLIDAPTLTINNGSCRIDSGGMGESCPYFGSRPVAWGVPHIAACLRI